MKSKIFSTHDRDAHAFMQPFCAPHAGVAIRGFTDAILKPVQPSDISNHPDSFDLYELGEFDADSGIITPLERPQMILMGKSVVAQEPPQEPINRNK